jgi:hypothetical protein
VDDLPEQENGFVFWSSTKSWYTSSFSLVIFCFTL